MDRKTLDKFYNNWLHRIVLGTIFPKRPDYLNINPVDIEPDYKINVKSKGTEPSKTEHLQRVYANTTFYIVLSPDTQNPNGYEWYNVFVVAQFDANSYSKAVVVSEYPSEPILNDIIMRFYRDTTNQLNKNPYNKR